jgi:hypothetical protein
MRGLFEDFGSVSSMGPIGDGSPPPIMEPAGIDGWQTLTPQRIVAMTSHSGRLFLATDRRVYELLADGKWYPMEFAYQELPA